MELKHNIYDVIFKRLKQSGDVEFLHYKNNVYTFKEIDILSDNLAYLLKLKGIGPNMLVGVYLERSADMLIALLAVLKAGGAFLPLEPNYPIERNRFIISDAKLDCIIVHNKYKDDLGIDESKMICLAADWKEKSTSCEPFEMLVQVDNDNLAYVMYTSGSTGKPKGVMIQQKALVNLIISIQNKICLTEKDVFLAVTTLCFDISILELFLPIYAKAKLVIAEQEIVADAKRLIQKIEDMDVTIMQATPSTWRMLLDSSWSGSRNMAILCGGEALSKKLAMSLLKKCRNLWNMYGPTETTIWSLIGKVSEDDQKISIGYPIDNTVVYILDDNMNEVAYGEIGELYIGGLGVAKGYLNRPEVTQERFIQNPIDDRCDIIYKTGDLVRRLDNNSLEYIQRADFQVKIRGFRIELNEIESMAISMGLPSSSVQHSCVQVATLLEHAFVAHNHRHILRMQFYGMFHPLGHMQDI
ncbi:amino acid adenylation domain-containing protein [Acetivibrio mesophilus]|uniref:Amino acid adenylation domain-containing protein n=1 Tax=Acetivibrio mesophilus TaxID=2487273 RepID=A0A4Q0I7J2_9FIRM|nr:amino acid adenylation domain-containing protein [Acetivibrio mesophilus]RXE60340.1 amino acid adenylation domain-containing protein [Acetivibrio mesophilus]